MKHTSYRERDYAFGQAVLSLRTAIGLTQTALAEYLGVSRRSVGEWEAGGSYPRVEHLKQFIALALKQGALPARREADEIRALWQAAHQKVLLDENWLAGLLLPPAPSALPAEPRQPERSAPALRYLPYQPTPFVGRDAELPALAAMLAEPACRLLTLLGPGGVGKSRLAQQVAAQTGSFADGVAFVALAPLGKPGQIVTAIAEAIGLTFSGQSEAFAQLLAYLRDRELLLVLDNFEHLLDGADLVHDILIHAPLVKLVVTSRERLNLQAEWLYDVQGLAFPPLPTLDAPITPIVVDLRAFSAVQLFMQRLAQVQPGPPPEAVLESAARICRQVAGMPLAIELAAANVRILPIAEIERQIGSNIDVLATSYRDIPARHRSMRAVIDQSWNLLAAHERRLFSHLAVFRGGCTAQAADRVAGATLSTLNALVEKSLVRYVDSTASPDRRPATPRFLLLEPIREYALEKLAESGDLPAVQRAHASYYTTLAESAARWDSPDIDSAIDRLNREHDNLLAVLQWTLDGGDHLLGLTLAAAIYRFWRNRGYIGEGRVWLADLLALGDSDDPRIRAARLGVTNGAAWLATDQYDFAEAERLLEESMALQRALGITGDAAEATLLYNAAIQARAVGQYQRATSLYEDALARLVAVDDRGTLGSGGRGYVLYGLASVLREQGDYPRATRLFEECLVFHQDIGERAGIAQSQLGLSDVARDRGDIDLTRAYCEQCLATFEEFGTQWAIGFTLNNLAQAALQAGELPQAHALSSRSVALFRGLRDDASVAEVLVTLGSILNALGDITAAYDALSEALRLAWVVGPRLLMATALEGLAATLTPRGQTRRAAQYLAAADQLRRQMGAPLRPADRAAYEATFAAAKTALGDAAFVSAWAAAAGLTLEQILSDAPNGVPAHGMRGNMD